MPWKGSEETGKWVRGSVCFLGLEVLYLAVGSSTPTLGTLLPSHSGMVFSGKSAGQLTGHSSAEDRSDQEEETVHGNWW